MRAGFTLQLVTVRWLGTFLDSPLDVPPAVLGFGAGQLGVADPLVVDKYGERAKTVSDHQLEVPPGQRGSDLERWRKGPPRGSGPSIIAALDQVAEIQSLGLVALGAEAVVPPRRLAELARYGMTADVWLIRRHPDDRRLATLLATVRDLEAKSVDDTLELLDLLMSAELLNKAQRESDKGKVRAHPRLAKASVRLAVAVEALFDSDGWGGPGEEPRVSAVWEAIESVVSRADLRAALHVVSEGDPARSARRTPTTGGPS